MTTPNQTEPRALKFAGVAVYVEDVRIVLDFYHRAFGYKTRFFDEALDYGELDAGDITLAFASHKTGEMLMPGRFVQPRSGQPSSVELAFFTSDVPAAFARAVEAGAVPLAEPKLMPWGMTVAYLRSIEGTIIGLSTPPANVSTAAQICSWHEHFANKSVETNRPPLFRSTPGYIATQAIVDVQQLWLIRSKI